MAKNASPGSLIKLARRQYAEGKDLESQGSMPACYASYMRAVSLARMALESPQKDPSLSKEINDFFEVKEFRVSCH
jgi:ubiquitin carboxyl-terminal hydrolase 8